MQKAVRLACLWTWTPSCSPGVLQVYCWTDDSASLSDNTQGAHGSHASLVSFIPHHKTIALEFHLLGDSLLLYFTGRQVFAGPALYLLRFGEQELEICFKTKQNTKHPQTSEQKHRSAGAISFLSMGSLRWCWATGPRTDFLSWGPWNKLSWQESLCSSRSKA